MLIYIIGSFEYQPAAYITALTTNFFTTAFGFVTALDVISLQHQSNLPQVNGTNNHSDGRRATSVIGTQGTGSILVTHADLVRFYTILTNLKTKIGGGPKTNRLFGWIGQSAGCFFFEHGENRSDTGRGLKLA